VRQVVLDGASSDRSAEAMARQLATTWLEAER